jgi:hypothetical protein
MLYGSMQQLIYSQYIWMSCGGIGKDDIYSSDDSTKHLEKVQETQTKTGDEKST